MSHENRSMAELCIRMDTRENRTQEPEDCHTRLQQAVEVGRITRSGLSREFHLECKEREAPKSHLTYIHPALWYKSS